MFRAISSSKKREKPGLWSCKLPGFEVPLRVRIFKNRMFSRFAAKAGITDGELRAIVADLEAGRIDADQGGDVYKQRVARQGGGKSGGFRTLIFFRSGFRTFFVFGFAKSDMDNINESTLRQLKKTARSDLGLTENELAERLRSGSFIEVIEEVNDGKEI
jgi:hypothetical protein